MSKLQRELRQGKPFSSTAHEAVLALMRTADVVRRQIASVVEPSGVTIQQYNVLRILRGGGSDGVPTLEVGARMVEPAIATRGLPWAVRASATELAAAGREAAATA